MAKLKERLDGRQLSIFEAIREISEPAGKTAGSLSIDRQFRETISSALKVCPMSRYQVASRMSELIGSEITKMMLDSWTAESKEDHRFPAIYLPAFCEATGQTEPLRVLGRLVGVFVLPGPEALRSEIQRLEEEIGSKQREKKKRLLFLKELKEIESKS